MTASMISFRTGQWHFNLRAAAVVRSGPFVLLHRMADDRFWSLPGGRVEIGETAEAAVRREMREELETDVQTGALLAVVENFFTYRGRRQHGLELHFDVTLPAGSPLVGCEPFERVDEGGIALDGDVCPSARLLFQWFHARDLGSIDLRPSFLRKSLAVDTSRGTRHVVHDDLR